MLENGTGYSQAIININVDMIVPLMTGSGLVNHERMAIFQMHGQPGVVGGKAEKPPGYGQHPRSVLDYLNLACRAVLEQKFGQRATPKPSTSALRGSGTNSSVISMARM